MILRDQMSKLWVVVEVKSGIPVAVEAFPDRKSAKVGENSLRRHVHPES